MMLGKQQKVMKYNFSFMNKCVFTQVGGSYCEMIIQTRDNSADETTNV